jgi:hypothetical protein
MAQTLTLESTVIQRGTGQTAEVLFVPAATLELAEIASPDEAGRVLGLPLGVPIRTSDEVEDLLFASLAGRVYPFGEGSFERWRPQRLERPGAPEAVFAKQLATEDLVPVSSSPIHGASITTLIAQGSAWAVSGADMLFHDPWQGLGLLAASEIGLTIVAVSRGARQTLVIAAKYHLRRKLGVPPDWMPPEDRG